MFRYQLTIRPTGPFTTPDHEGRMFSDDDLPFYASRGHGSVWYSSPLSARDVSQYSLIPVTEAMALNGHVYAYQIGKDTVHYTLTVDANASIFAQGRLGKPNDANYAEHDEYVTHSDVAAKVEKGEWVRVVDLDNVESVGFDSSFMEREFNPALLTTVGEERLLVTLRGNQLPADHLLMKTETEYIFRCIPQAFDDGFNIYRAKR